MPPKPGQALVPVELLMEVSVQLWEMLSSTFSKPRTLLRHPQCCWCEHVPLGHGSCSGTIIVYVFQPTPELCPILGMPERSKTGSSILGLSAPDLQLEQTQSCTSRVIHSPREVSPCWPAQTPSEDPFLKTPPRVPTLSLLPCASRPCLNPISTLHFASFSSSCPYL